MKERKLNEEELSLILGEHDAGMGPADCDPYYSPYDSVEYVLLRLEELGYAELP